MSGLAAIGGAVNYRQQAADDRPDQERTRYVDRYARHLPHAFRLGRQHNGAGARLSLRRQLLENRQLHRRRLPDRSTTSRASSITASTIAFKVFARGRVQARRRPRLLGHAADDDGVLRAVLHPRRRGRDRRSTPSPATSHFGPVTVDSRTTRTNYNVADNRVGAHELWLRGGFELKVTHDITIKNQAYEYGAKRHWYRQRDLRLQPRHLDDRPRPILRHAQAAGDRQQHRS